MTTTELHLICEPFDESVDGNDLEELVLDLKREIEQAPLSGFQIEEVQRHSENTLGPEWLPILTAVVSSHLAVEVAKGLTSIIRDWLRRNKPISVTIKGPTGDYAITAAHISGDELEKIVAKLLTGPPRHQAAKARPGKAE